MKNQSVRSTLLRVQHVDKTFHAPPAAPVTVLHDVCMELDAGEFVALIGPSGSGKSTLLNLIGLLDRPSSGQLWLNEQEVSGFDEDRLTRVRGHTLGFVFQSHYLLGALSAEENVMVPAMMAKGRADVAQRQRAASLLEQVGLAAWRTRPVGQLSGGQQQRVAIARALMMHPLLILADEPTGNLDTQSSDAIFALLRRINQEEGTGFLMVTHNLDLARRCDRIIELIDGRVAHRDG